MESEFLRKSEELSTRIKQLEITKGIAREKVNEKIKSISEELDKLEALGPAPIINGEPVYDLTIDRTKLGNYAYVQQMCNILPAVLSNMEQVGMQLINDLSE